MNKTTWVALAAVIIVGGGTLYFTNSQKQVGREKDRMGQQESKMTGDENASPEKTAMQKEDTMDKTDGVVENEEVMVKAGTYKDYSPAALAEAAKDNGKVVLFFHATWCPFCKTANEAFTSRASEIPAGVTVLKTDYDTQKELKTKYGVTYQHTFVQVDASGNQLTKWNGGDIDALKANIK